MCRISMEQMNIDEPVHACMTEALELISHRVKCVIYVLEDESRTIMQFQAVNFVITGLLWLLGGVNV